MSIFRVPKIITNKLDQITHCFFIFMQQNHKDIGGSWGLCDEIIKTIGKDRAIGKIVEIYVDAANNMKRKMEDDAINLNSNGGDGAVTNPFT